MEVQLLGLFARNGSRKGCTRNRFFYQASRLVLQNRRRSRQLNITTCFLHVLLLAAYFALPPGRTGNRPCVIHICECGRCSTNPRAFELTHNLWTFMVWRSFAAIYHLRGVLAKAPIIRNGSLWKKFFNLQYAKSFLPDSQGTRLRPVGSMTIDESYAMSIAPQIDQKLVDTLSKIDFALPIPHRPFFRFVVPEVAQWKALTIPDIHKLLTERKLPKSGNKKELLERLNRFELDKLAHNLKTANG